jgi:hypothetical protein
VAGISVEAFWCLDTFGANPNRSGDMMVIEAIQGAVGKAFNRGDHTFA